MADKVKLTAEEAQEKHARRLKGSVSDIVKGIEKVTVSPTAKAAEKIDKMKAHLDEAFASGKVERALKRVSLDEWKSKAAKKIPSRLGAGIDEAKDKMTDFFSKLFAHQNSGLPKIKEMPDLTKEDTKARMVAWFEHMSKFHYK